MDDNFYNEFNEEESLSSQEIFGLAAGKLIDEMINLQAIEDRENSIDDGTEEPDEDDTTVDSYDVGLMAILKTIDAVNEESGDALCYYEWLHILNDAQNQIVELLHESSTHHRLGDIDINMN